MVLRPSFTQQLNLTKLDPASLAYMDAIERDIAPGLTPWQYEIAMSERSISSQSGQDGVINFLFKQVATTNRFYVEFGFNSHSFEGSGANTMELSRQGWSGLLMDGSFQNASINLHREQIGPHNIQELLQKYSVPIEFDYLSIDIDSYDLWVFREIVVNSPWKPRVISVEYNPAFALSSTLTLHYPKRVRFWPFGDHVFGASLGALDLVAQEGGYTMVYVVSGLDAFFVRSDLLGDLGFTVTPFSLLPPERLTDGACGQRAFRLSLAGVTPHLGFWCTRPPVTLSRVYALEDYLVFHTTGNHHNATRAMRLRTRARLLQVPQNATGMRRHFIVRMLVASSRA